MTALEELVNILQDFTPEQLNQFLQDPVTVSVLQPEAGAAPDLQEVS